MPITVATGPDHIVLRVQDPVKSVQWYSETLGLQPVRLDEYHAGECAVASQADPMTAVHHWEEVGCCCQAQLRSALEETRHQIKLHTEPLLSCCAGKVPFPSVRVTPTFLIDFFKQQDEDPPEAASLPSAGSTARRNTGQQPCTTWQ
jgi:hypothetical protein